MRFYFAARINEFYAIPKNQASIDRPIFRRALADRAPDRLFLG
jgi:hypothetical protein